MKRNRSERGRASERWVTYRKRTRSVPINVSECTRTDGQGYWKQWHGFCESCYRNVRCCDKKAREREGESIYYLCSS